MRRSPMLMVTVLSSLGLTLAGCGGGGGGGGVDLVGLPTITAAQVTPTELRFTGGAVSIAATVQAGAPIVRVSAAVTGAAGTKSVTLTLNGGQYAGAFEAPPNGGADATSYTVMITATATGGRVSAPFSADGFTVEPAAPPPDAPPGW